MSATTIFIIAIVGAGVLAAIGVFTIAARRSPGRTTAAEPLTGSLDRRAVRQDRAAAAQRAGASATAVMTRPEAEVSDEEAAESAQPEAAETAPGPAVVEPVIKKEQVTAAEFGVTRRQFFNRAILLLFGGAFLGTLGIGMLAFLWPKLGEGFGTKIVAGNLGDLRAATLKGDGTISPVFVAAAQSWLVPFDPDLLTGSSFEGLPVVAGGGGGELGMMALWQRCVHLGCRVPSCESSQGFECPCHGSKYNFHGEYRDGPAPRNMDRFAVEEDGAGNLVVDTGQVLETSRAKVTTIAYPQGPSCL